MLSCHLTNMFLSVRINFVTFFSCFFLQYILIVGESATMLFSSMKAMPYIPWDSIHTLRKEYIAYPFSSFSSYYFCSVFLFAMHKMYKSSGAILSGTGTEAMPRMERSLTISQRSMQKASFSIWGNSPISIIHRNSALSISRPLPLKVYRITKINSSISRLPLRERGAIHSSSPS